MPFPGRTTIYFTHSRVTVLPQESKGFSIYLYPEQYNYRQGKYRVCKTVSTTKHKDDPNCILYNLTAPAGQCVLIWARGAPKKPFPAGIRETALSYIMSVLSFLQKSFD
jgi:hypothetical protein